MVNCSLCLLMCMCTIVVFLDFSRCFLMSFFMRHVQVFRKPFLVALITLAAFGLKSSACKYWASYGCEFCDRMLFTTFSDCCVPRLTYHIPVFLFLIPLIIYFPLFWIEIYCLSSVMVYPSSPNDINGAVCIFGKMWIYLYCFLIPSIWSVAICEDSIVLPSGSLDFISFSIIKGATVGVACFDGCMFAPESTISIMLVLV